MCTSEAPPEAKRVVLLEEEGHIVRIVVYLVAIVEVGEKSSHQRRPFCLGHLAFPKSPGDGCVRHLPSDAAPCTRQPNTRDL